MAWGIGANDVANAMGTSVGSRALTLGQAVMVACIFEFAGHISLAVKLLQQSGKASLKWCISVSQTAFYGMTSALLAAGIWLLIASYFGWPVSTTHSIVGAIVGFAAVGISEMLSIGERLHQLWQAGWFHRFWLEHFIPPIHQCKTIDTSI
ncbi:MAG: hypothetical protein Ct9H90mP13_10550 [Pseudomonadota bacterium]|nr:MAG: hypothetical protein Ct9H90mP13_10550 [Pseudomonadota bacterium]